MPSPIWEEKKGEGEWNSVSKSLCVSSPAVRRWYVRSHPIHWARYLVRFRVWSRGGDSAAARSSAGPGLWLATSKCRHYLELRNCQNRVSSSSFANRDRPGDSTWDL